MIHKIHPSPTLRWNWQSHSAVVWQKNFSHITVFWNRFNQFTHFFAQRGKHLFQKKIIYTTISFYSMVVVVEGKKYCISRPTSGCVMRDPVGEKKIFFFSIW
jgi:hypothetical protein